MIIEKTFPLQFHQKEKRKCRFFLTYFKNIKNFEFNWQTSIIWILHVLHIGFCFHNSLIAEKFIRFVFTIIDDIADNIFCFEAASIWAAKISWSFNCNMKIASDIDAAWCTCAALFHKYPIMAPNGEMWIVFIDLD